MYELMETRYCVTNLSEPLDSLIAINSVGNRFEHDFQQRLSSKVYVQDNLSRGMMTTHSENVLLSQRSRFPSQPASKDQLQNRDEDQNDTR